MEISVEYSTAIHEAGHAVMSVIYKRNLEYVTIVANGRVLGGCHNGDDTPKVKTDVTDGLIALREVLILLAGPTAESVILGINPKDTRGKDDYVEADKIFDAPNDGLGKERADDATRQIFSIIRNPLVQQQIKAVADALMEQKTLSGEQVKQIIETAGGR